MADAVVSSDVADGAPTVTVIGTAVVRVAPDEAVLWISLVSLQDTPGSALADVSARSERLVGLLDELGVEGADRSSTGVTVHEEVDHTPGGRRTLGHRATSRMFVRLSDPVLIGRLIAQATDALAARIDGPWWVISPTNPVRLEVARQAAGESRRKAEAFAAGVGARLGPLIRMVEPEPHVAIRAASRSPMAREGMPVEPGEHEVTAAVQATFALVAG